MRLAPTLFLLLVVPVAGDAQRQPPVDWQRMAVYLGLNLSAADRDTLTALTLRVEDSTRTRPERTRAGLEIATRLIRSAGQDTTGRTRQLEVAVGRPVTGNYALGLPFDAPTAPLGHLPEIIRRGSGPTPLVLITDYRKNWRIYERFIEANADRFTMYTFSFPGYGGTLPFPLPQRAEYGRRAWLEGIVDGLERFIRSERLQRPLLVASLDGGTYVAVRTAQRMPDIVAGVVTLNGTLFEEALRSPSDTGKRLTESERTELVPRVPGTILWPVFAPPPRNPEAIPALARRPIAPQNPIRVYARDSSALVEIYAMHLAFAPYLERYDFERQTADLRATVASLPVPLLAVLGAADSAAVLPVNEDVQRHWRSFLAESPRAPVTVSLFRGVGVLISVDAPRALGDTLAAFASGRLRPRNR